jgi:uncharacterized SAM-binding protein YcdF (DUF218 family)
MKAKIISFSLLVLIILVYTIGCNRAGSWLVKRDEPVHADAIIILMGSIADRVLQAADLYLNGLADQVIIVEANMDAYNSIKARGVNFVNRTEQARSASVDLGIPSGKIVILPGEATSTQSEALIIRKYVEENPGLDTILLVTSSPHTRRASLIFNTAFRKAGINLFVVSSPSTYTIYNPENWWRRKEDIQTVLFEYIKLSNFVLFEARRLKQHESDGSERIPKPENRYEK